MGSESSPICSVWKYHKNIWVATTQLLFHVTPWKINMGSILMEAWFRSFSFEKNGWWFVGEPAVNLPGCKLQECISILAVLATFTGSPKKSLAPGAGDKWWPKPCPVLMFWTAGKFPPGSGGRSLLQPPWKLTWLTGKSPVFNRKYIFNFKWWIFQPVMFVFGGWKQTETGNTYRHVCKMPWQWRSFSEVLVKFSLWWCNGWFLQFVIYIHPWHLT